LSLVLHPAGCALGISYAMNYFWLCVFIAWVAKFLIVHYGGMTLRRRVIPFFLRLLLQQPTYKIYL
jgi:hypothetical protein